MLISYWTRFPEVNRFQMLYNSGGLLYPGERPVFGLVVA